MKCEICKKEVKNFKGLTSHIYKSHKISSEEYYLQFIGKKKSCEICGNKTKFISIEFGYRDACSLKCGSLLGAKRNRESILNLSIERKQQRSQNISEKYYSKSDHDKNEILNKRKQTNKRKFGEEFASQSDEIRSKISKNKINLTNEQKESIQKL